MRLKYEAVDLANMMLAYAEDPGRLVIENVFVSQMLMENPRPNVLSEKVQMRLQAKSPAVGQHSEEASDWDFLTWYEDEAEEKVHLAYIGQTSRDAIEVISDPRNRLLVLLGEPGSGKSTLLRYLLLAVLSPPVNAATGLPLPWTQAFSTTFPLLIELRDFSSQRARCACDSFLEYVELMGKTEHWPLDAGWLDQRLEQGPSLAMFDGLDEIFDRAERERVIEQQKNGVHALKAPLDNLNSNWAYMVMASLAWSLKAWAALLIPVQGRWKEKHEAEKKALLRMDFATFRNAMIAIPAQIVRNAGKIIYRLLAWNPWQSVFFRLVEQLSKPMRC